MKKIKTGLIRTYDKLIILLLGLMGLATRCMPVAEYGTPHADFHFKGNISGSNNQAPIENIQVKIYEQDTLLLGQGSSDNTGAYAIDLEMFPINQQIRISVEDTDGAENGTYAGKDSVINVDVSNLSGGDGDWYEGEMDVITDFSLEEDNN